MMPRRKFEKGVDDGVEEGAGEDMLAGAEVLLLCSLLMNWFFGMRCYGEEKRGFAGILP